MIKIGTDPEVFLRNTATGTFVSAHGMFPGTKEDPYPLSNMGHMQVDGHALEFNTPAAETEDEFTYFVTTVFGEVQKMVKAVSPNLEIVLEPVARFDDMYFAQLPAVSKELGCNPDYSMVNGKVLKAPAIGEVPIRTGSGHIHIGWTDGEDAFEKKAFKQRLAVAQKVTPHLLSIAKGWENDDSVERRKYYGGNGAFRPKPYGVELRCLDNLWLKSEETIRQVYRTTVEAFTKEFPQYAH